MPTSTLTVLSARADSDRSRALRSVAVALWLAAQVQDVQDQLDQIDAHYRATEPTRTGGVG